MEQQCYWYLYFLITLHVADTWSKFRATFDPICNTLQSPLKYQRRHWLWLCVRSCYSFFSNTALSFEISDKEEEEEEEEEEVVTFATYVYTSCFDRSDYCWSQKYWAGSNVVVKLAIHVHHERQIGTVVPYELKEWLSLLLTPQHERTHACMVTHNAFSTYYIAGTYNEYPGRVSLLSTSCHTQVISEPATYHEPASSAAGEQYVKMKVISIYGSIVSQS